MSFLIVSGFSGSGKSIALEALEDKNFYCIDNLPPALLANFAEQVKTAKTDSLNNIAVGIDARNRSFLDDLPDSLSRLESRGIQYRIIFLEADESILVKRFKETRRKHPLTDKKTSLLEAIRKEKQLLEPLSANAAIRIDTTHTTPHELRHQISDYARGEETSGITLLFESFGYKHGTPLDADYVFDVRCLPNPYWQSDLRKYTGLDEPVISYLEKDKQVHAMYEDIKSYLEKWLPSFEREDRTYMTIAVGCTGGQHRSVYLAVRLAGYFSDMGIKTQIRHRELT